MYIIVISHSTVDDPFLVLNLFNGFKRMYDKTIELIIQKRAKAGGKLDIDIEPNSDEIFKNETTNTFIRSILTLLAFSGALSGLTAITSGGKYTRRKTVVKKPYKTKRQLKVNLKGKKYVTRKLIKNKVKGKGKGKKKV